MGTFRMYTGTDGQTHIETIDLDKTASWKDGLQTTNITFRSAPVGTIPGLASGTAPPVRHHPLGPPRNRPGRRLKAHLRPWRCALSRRHHGKGPHHGGAWL